MSKHTPGPWFYDVHPDKSQAIFWDSRGYTVFHLSHTFPNDVRANARLIAAAPDLLAALKDAVEIAESQGHIVKTARAAIAKATGGEK